MPDAFTCEWPGCDEDGDVDVDGDHFCFFHARASETTPRVDSNGAASTLTRPKTKPWTREEAIAAVQAFHARTGRVPSWTDLKTANGLPGKVVVGTKLPKLNELIEAAGFEPTPSPLKRVPQARRAPDPPQPVQKEPPKDSGSMLVQLAHAVDNAYAEMLDAQRAAAASELAYEAAKDALRGELEGAQ